MNLWINHSDSADEGLDTNMNKPNIMVYTGWPVIHGRLFLVPCKKWLVHCQMYACFVESLDIKSLRYKVPEIHGDVYLVGLYSRDTTVTCLAHESCKEGRNHIFELINGFASTLYNLPFSALA